MTRRRGMMRRAAGAAGALAVGVVMMSAAPAVAAPAVHTVEDVTGDVLVCGSTTYTITSGTIKFTSHEGVSASGNENFTGTITPAEGRRHRRRGQRLQPARRVLVRRGSQRATGDGRVHQHRQAAGGEPRHRERGQLEPDDPRHAGEWER